eukprot:Skav232270  [mRNA]  locus=scaffold882:116094:127418:- [translate_table: standard]
MRTHPQGAAVQQLDAEREQLAQKIQLLKAKTERDEGFAQLLQAERGAISCFPPGKEREEKMEQLRDMDSALSEPPVRQANLVAKKKEAVLKAGPGGGTQLIPELTNGGVMGPISK